MKLFKNIFLAGVFIISLTLLSACSIFKKSDCNDCPGWGEKEIKSTVKNQNA